MNWLAIPSIVVVGIAVASIYFTHIGKFWIGQGLLWVLIGLAIFQALQLIGGGEKT